MKLVQTLVVRDEADIVDAQITYHLNAGVDFVIATDHASLDGTTEILEAHARAGHLLRLAESGEVHEARWRTRMARLAASEYGADWVINTDADEFWAPHRGTLKETFAAIPRRYGVVWALSRHFVPRPDDGGLFADRMTVRLSSPAAMNDPTSPYRPHSKAAHRGDPEIAVGFGSHTVFTKKWQSLHHWHPADVLHFPFRSLEQWERKGVRRARGDKPLGQYVKALEASEQGRAADHYRSLVVDDVALATGLADGSLVVDTRLQDRLRELDAAGSRPRSPTELRATPDASIIAESAALRDADLVRLFRRIDGLRKRLSALEDGAGTAPPEAEAGAARHA